MPYDLALVRQVGILTFSVQIAVIGSGIRRALHRVHRLLKDVIDESVVRKVQLAELYAVRFAQYLPACVHNKATQDKQ